MEFAVDAMLGASHSIRVRMVYSPSEWWMVTFIDPWETALLTKQVLDGLAAVREFVGERTVLK